MRTGERSSISCNRNIGSRPRAFQRAVDELCMLPLSPSMGGTKRDFAVFASKIQLLSKKVCYKVSLCENFQRQSCSYIIPYVTVHRCISVDDTIYLKFALKVTHPSEKRRFRQISLNSASAVKACEKSVIANNRKSTMRFPSSYR